MPLTQALVVTRNYEDWEHANVQAGIDAYLAEHGVRTDWFGIAGGQRGHEDLVGMLFAARNHRLYELGAVDCTTATNGPDAAAEVVQLGLVGTAAPDGTSVIVGVRGTNQQYGQMYYRPEVIAGERAAATATPDRIEQLIAEHECCVATCWSSA
ncbi:hypothetical protein AB0F91_32115 [Amycolatopsis sp. NPDC023774]|uniref:hypothetical protein n=1 Tax=Amycolatopsis sp. NPDC023774 TaxID=3155015 RepID=UPI0033E4C108